MVIPANVNHTNLEPMGIGIALALQGEREHRQQRRSRATSRASSRKLAVSLKYGADTVMDLSTGGDIDGIRRRIIADSPVPIGTVPVYQALKEREGRPKHHAPTTSSTCSSTRRKQGVDYFTIHAGVLVEHLPLVKDRITGHRVARRLDHGRSG